MEKKTVVITGSARGLGFEMAKCFKRRNFNVVICDINENDIHVGKEKLSLEKGHGEIMALVCDITKSDDLNNLIKTVKKKFKTIDFWINNAGVNQPNKMIWELTDEEISQMIDIDLKGTIMASKYAMTMMKSQGFGSIYTVEGHGSNDAIIPGISLYGTAKRGVTYFIKALAKEAETSRLDILVGALSPGIMITDFLVNAFCNKKIELSEKNKKVYNILGDYPDVVAKYLVSKMISNTNNGVRIKWLTNWKVMWRFVSRTIRKRNFFDKK